MTRSPNAGDASTQYRAAHDTHYTAKDLTRALDLYVALTKDHSDSTEAAYGRTQIGNMVRSIVSPTDLLATHIHLVVRPSGRDDRRAAQRRVGADRLN